MKKIFSILTLAILFTVLVAPIVAAQTIPSEIDRCTMRYDLVTDTNWAAKGFNCVAKGQPCIFTDTTKTCGICCTMDTVYTVTGWIFIGIVVLSTIMILIGAYNILTAGADPAKVTTGRNYIIYAAVGLIIALLAKVIPSIAKNIIGM